MRYVPSYIFYLLVILYFLYCLLLNLFIIDPCWLVVVVQIVQKEHVVQLSRIKEHNENQNVTPSDQFCNPTGNWRNRDKMDTPNIHVHNHLLSWLSDGISIKSGGIKPVLWDKASHLTVIMRPCMFFPRVPKMPNLNSEVSYFVFFFFFLFHFRVIVFICKEERWKSKDRKSGKRPQ